MEGKGPLHILGQNWLILEARRPSTGQKLRPHAGHCHSSQRCPTSPPRSHLHPMAPGCDISIQHHCRYGALSTLLWFYYAAA